ncbi:MAG: hypothetical protein RIF33_04480 [Cyclobacteriaceae bacterium]
MEPSDFDKAIQDKLQQKPDLHRQEMERAKLGIWSQVDHNLQERRTPWWLLVAAALLLLIGFSYVLIHFQERHQQELISLKNQLDQVQKQYEQQTLALTEKNEDVLTLEGRLSQMDVQLTAQRVEEPQQVVERVVHQTDTVYVTEVQYLTVAAPAVDPTGNNTLASASVSTEQDESINDSDEPRPTFIAIASTSSDQNTNQHLKVRFGSFAKKLRNP